VTGGRLVEGYGLTEASPVVCANPIVGTRKTGSIGVPLPGTAARIVDPEEPAREIEPGSSGELAVSGPQVFAGYWRTSTEGEADRAFTDDGYLLTGDIAVMDPDGFFTIVDRKKELIIAGGFNIYPSEVEDALLSHPAIVDAAAIGVPDPYRGETVKAFVVRRPGATLTADEVRAHAARSLTGYKVPTIVEFRDELPHSTIGKVLRRRLRDGELQAIAEAAR
jgi:long-chain acyl-CoA synthetase